MTIEGFRVVVRLRDGDVDHGHGLTFDPERPVIAYGSRPDGKQDRVWDLSDVRLVVLIRRPGPSTGRSLRLETAARVQVSFPDGAVLWGESIRTPWPGGLWLRPAGVEGDGLIALVPEGAAETIQTFEDDGEWDVDTPILGAMSGDR